eukprot:TRINITY_DN13889_c0_g2_i2.p1 TRINITY_DN13889_c0_g2~~TRINITY_DN13889_c0_g2_i2.p1  ORF type:complete len:241 (-),score=21.62 TRINITY_DN13889_c0_g2_i2:179-901(-)
MVEWPTGMSVAPKASGSGLLRGLVAAGTHAADPSQEAFGGMGADVDAVNESTPLLSMPPIRAARVHASGAGATATAGAVSTVKGTSQQQPANGRAVDAKAAGEGGDRRWAGHKVMVVDDNLVNRKVVSRLLQRLGLEPTAVDSGAAAVAALQPPHQFEVVFMDLQMPGMDGLEATRRMREAEGMWNSRHQQSLHVPVFALTADSIGEVRQRCEAAGMDGCLSKPIEERELLRALAASLPE